ncbi:MAG: PspC domain protein [Acidobacteria bacterium]|nr:PspC domain protein [Acidobacteriota bacterium]
MTCKTAMAALLASIENGDTLTPEVREHLRTCEQCKELLSSAMQFQSTLSDDVEVPETDIDQTTAAAEKELGRTKLRNRIQIAATAALVLIPIVAYIASHTDGFHPSGIAFELGVVVSLTIVLPIVIVRLLVARIRTRAGQRLYKRIGNGRHEVSGVCAGIAEATGISVVTLRIAFLALLFFKGLGLLIYLAFDLGMQIHPADREHLRRFRIRRALAATLARVRMH